MQELHDNGPNRGGPNQGDPGQETPAQPENRITVGDRLRMAREQRGQELRAVADTLRIRFVFLEAIERGDFASLPGDTYAYGFVRTYANYLNLNETEIVDQFKQEVADYGRRQQLVFPTPVPKSKMPGFAILLVSLLMLGGAYMGWSFYTQSQLDLASWLPFDLNRATVSEPVSEEQSQDVAATPSQPEESEELNATTLLTEEETASEPVIEVVPPSPEAETAEAAEEAGATETEIPAAPAAPESEEPAVSTASEVDETVTEIPAAPAAEAEENVAEAVAGEEEQSDAEAGDVAVVTPPAPPEPEVFGEEASASPIVITAERDTWMHITDGQGEIVFSRVLRAGDRYNVPNRDDLTMVTGNAGGIEIEINGEVIPKLGPLGAVRRDIPLSVEGLTSLPQE